MGKCQISLSSMVCSSTANQSTWVCVLLKLFAFSFHVFLCITIAQQYYSSQTSRSWGTCACLCTFKATSLVSSFPIWKENLHQIHQEAIRADRSYASTSSITQATSSSSFMHAHFLWFCDPPFSVNVAKSIWLNFQKAGPSTSFFAAWRRKKREP